jgi:hypothetical protein
MHFDAGGEQPELPACGHCSAGAGATRQCFTRAAFVHPQADVPGIDDLHEANVDLSREFGPRLHSLAEPLDWRTGHVRNAQHRMRVAHR